MTNLYVLDTETTDATDDRGVCEIGWVRIDENWNILETVESLIDPQKPISHAASGIHGLTNEDVADAPTIEEFFGQVYGKRLQGPVVLIGHRVGFDRPAVEPFVDGEIAELDTLRFVRWLYPDADNHQLSTMKYQLNLPKEHGAAHRVLSDVMVTYHLAKHIAERLNMTLPELAARAQEPLPVHSLPFGKHKGQPLDTVPKSYLRWLVGSDMKLDSDYMHTINAILGTKQ
jgi:exodeoxyribonuclease X